ncbi:hypothetical protein E4U60_003247 [Claviceps pazoutovae]|uniref:Uncharacterized protein n=1 Tax=Claviceps pazoutovae TaxID=1649127 RepID=A0A9P7MAA7_9HYPO|nr:hypothetical protein E4U60_003247 [Claviceps pazoutovae]
MKTTIFLFSLLSIGATALPEPEEVVVFDGKHTYRGGDVKLTKNTDTLCRTCNANANAKDAGPGASNAHLISANALAAPAAGHVITADIIARTAPTLAIAPIRRLLTDHGLFGGRLLARARDCLDV